MRVRCEASVALIFRLGSERQIDKGASDQCCHSLASCFSSKGFILLSTVPYIVLSKLAIFQAKIFDQNTNVSLITGSTWTSHKISNGLVASSEKSLGKN